MVIRELKLLFLTWTIAQKMFYELGYFIDSE